MKRVHGILFGAVTLGFVLTAVFVWQGVRLKKFDLAPRPSPLVQADAVYATKPKEAKRGYEAFVQKNATSRNPETQDHVGAARMRLGYLAAKRKDLPAAREAFLAAAKTQGTGAMGEFGTVGDQAAYQAAVCLVAEGKKDEAERAFVSLLRERPFSPLSRAAHRRLTLLNGGKARPEWDALLQATVTKQEARIRFETSVCGPKCLARIVGGDYKAIAKLCGTTDMGTTVEGMRNGLRELGRESWAARLNRQDLGKAKLPAILLQDDHYVVLERIQGDEASVWDPRAKNSVPLRLPPLDDPDFTAAAILLSKPEGLK